MYRHGGQLLLSASDLVGHLSCAHLTALDIAVADGTLAKPATWDPLLELLWARGAQHEHGFVEHLKAQGFEVTVIDGVGVDDDAASLTRDAMLRGDSIIVQGALKMNGWVGRTDVLRRIDKPSDLGTWSYEIIDTKLARETKAGAVLQLCLYAALLEATQGRCPEHCYVVAPWSEYKPQTYRMDDYAAYYRRVRGALEAAVALAEPLSVYPDPKEHCEICRWRDRCNDRRRSDDHLSLVAGITKTQIGELVSQGISTLASLAEMPIPLTWKPTRGSAQAYERAREQARIQLVGRQAAAVVHELLPVTAGFGLSALPAPSAGDIFLDLEGDPFVGEGGLEYVFGYAYTDADGKHAHISDWALSRESERQIFERFIDFVTERLKVYPDLHIYHFAPYEPAALKRLMGRYASREEEIDSLLRSRRLVDLYAVVRKGLRASVESYSIKKLEPLYGFARVTSLAEANKALTTVQTGLELGDLNLIDDTTRDAVSRYNQDDCESTRGLRDWLETQRADLIAQGAECARPASSEAAPSEALGEWQLKIAELIVRLTGNVSADVAERSEEQHACWLLAHSLDWHRREQKAVWWEFFRLSELAADDLLDERAGLSGLSFVDPQGGTARAPIHRYAFPPQETEMRGSEDLYQLGGAKLGSVHAVSLDERWIDIKKRMDCAALHPEAVFSHKVVNSDVLADALVRLGEHVATHGIAGPGPFLAARDLLLRIGPRIGGQAMQHAEEATVDAARRVVLALEGGVLPIQGPPGSGKTFTGARMICALVQGGKKVGICATSHKVVRNMLDEVIKAADEQGLALQCVQKPAEQEPEQQPRLRFARTGTDLFAFLACDAQVAGGTAWLWASPNAAQSVDVLFVDEAAQMSLANVLAISQAAPRLVLLGDPQQLDQPMQGSHPEGTDVSALHHLIGDAQTLEADRGLFLSETWRMHPDICRFTSEMFYANRLQPSPGLQAQSVKSASQVQGTGLRYLAIPTTGNQSSSPEEADAIQRLVSEIMAGNTTWTDKHGVERPVTLQDILIIAPYNAQVFELAERIPGARIGTVDKFQGQEAPIVIYSITTSSFSDAPRGMEFLYSLNRLNVATSRAKCLCILVASPSVFEVSCKTPRQMQLANAFCRYLELATPLVQLLE